MKVVVLVALLGACSFQKGTALSQQGSAMDDGPPGDVRPDVRPIDARPIDAPTDAKVFMDAPVTCVQITCAAAGGTCNAGVCDITAPNGQQVMCPVAETCAVSCPTDNQSCLNGMTCPNFATCTWDCQGDHTCETNPLTCDTGSTCILECRSTHACDNLIVNCNGGATCKYYCCGGNACANFTCNGAGCMDMGSTCPP